MKSLIALLLVTSFSTAHAVTEDTNAELMKALQGLRGRVTTDTIGDNLVSLGENVGFSSMALVGFLALMFREIQRSPVPPPEYLAQINPGQFLAHWTDMMRNGVVAGLGVVVLGYAYKLVRYSIRYGKIEDYHTGEGLKLFFSRSIARQYEIAHQDPMFAKFLIDLNAHFDQVDGGFVAPTPVAQ